MAAVAAISTAVIAAAGTTYGIVKQNEAANKQREFQDAQAKKQDAMFEEQRVAEANAREQQKKLEEEQALSLAEEEGQAEARQRRDTAKNRQRKLAMGAQGRSDTILTGPQGIVEEPEKKTILGV